MLNFMQEEEIDEQEEMALEAHNTKVAELGSIITREENIVCRARIFKESGRHWSTHLT